MRASQRHQGEEVAAAAGGISTNGGGRGGGGGGRSSCLDCGNKAKRDCEHNRCRTCCKSRGFACATHVKSTWVPVSRRRQRHHLSLLDPHHHFFPLTRSALSLRDLSPSSAGLEGGGGGGGGGNFPSEVHTMATFRCVRVSSDDNVVDQCAYQTSVNIGGHLFRGIIYDHGPVDTPMFGAGSGSGCGGGGDSSSSEHQPHPHYFVHHQLELQQPNASGSGGGNGGGMNLLYPPAPPPPTSSFFPPAAPHFNAFMSPGMRFFPHPRS